MDIKEKIINAYRKFKSYVFYGGSLEYIKPSIADFEIDSIKMESIFDNIALAIEKNDFEYFNNLINKVAVKVFPKAFKTLDDDNDVLTNKNEDKIIVEKINFFIGAPIEIFIIDAYWSCILAGATSFDKQMLRNSYGNSLSYNLFSNYSSNNLIDRINFQSLSFYDKYFDKYKKWRNGAINSLDFNYSRCIDSSMISLDLSRFYYSANASFEEIFDKLSNNGSNYSDYLFIQNVMEKVYKHYANILRKYDLSIKKDRCPIPIGLMSSGLIANIILDDFDQAISRNANVSYYARYVDDILIVTFNKIYDSVEESVRGMFSELIKIDNDSHYYLSFDNYLIIQNNKVKMFKVYANGSRNIIDSLKKESFEVSEQRLFPDVSIEIENFKSGVYKSNDSIKVRDKTGLIIDNKKLIFLLNSFLNSNKFNGSSTNRNRKDVEAMLSDAKELVTSLFNSRDLLTIYQKWNKIVLFGYSSGSNNAVGTISNEIKSGIKSLDLLLDFSKFAHKQKLLRIMQNSMRILLEVALSQKQALVGEKLGKKFRNANLIDYYCVCFPTINYYNVPDTLNLYKMSINDLIDIPNLTIDKNKIQYSPKFIHLGSYLSTANLVDIICNKKVSNPTTAYEFYLNNIAPFFGTFERQISIKNVPVDSSANLIDIVFGKEKLELENNEAFIGLANINLDNHEIEKDKKLADTFYCDKGHLIDLISILNNCDLAYWEPIEVTKKKSKKKRKKKLEFKKRNLDFLIFPEAYLEIEYLQYLEFYSRKTNTTIITGLKYIKLPGLALNIQAVVIPFTDSFGRRSAFTLFREKNNYSPHEKEILNNSKFACRDSVPAEYYRFKNQDGIYFTAFICYELTDIKARATMQNKVDLLFASEYNADIKYFSSIIESTSRELYCYVAQSNSSNYGGTRLMAPFHSNYKVVASISGGIRSFVHVEKVDVDLLRRYLSKFTACETKCDFSSLEIGEFKRFKKPSANVKKR